MNLFGLDERHLTPVLERLAVAPLGMPTTALPDLPLGDPNEGSLAWRTHPVREPLLSLAAHAILSTVTEPGDGVLGRMCTVLGAVTVVEWLTGSPSVETLFTRSVEPAALDTLSPDDVAAGLGRWLPRLRSANVVTALEAADRVGARLMVAGDVGWPRGVDDLGDFAPIVLWIRGRIDAVPALERSISLVGARASTGYGDHVTIEASAGLVDRGFAIVSGAAYGIDGAAHRAALASSGVTIALLAGGVDRFYPAGHDDLLTRIAADGAVISELPCGASPTKWRFLQRNRLIAAASQVTIVLEAGSRSGSLNTAGHAAALGRSLGAVPGPVTSAASAGCHRLLREYAAVCVTSAEEIAELHPSRGDGDGDAALSDDEASDASGTSTRVLDALSARSARTAADVAVRSGLAVLAVASILGTLELDGRARRAPAGWLRASGHR